MLPQFVLSQIEAKYLFQRSFKVRKSKTSRTREKKGERRNKNPKSDFLWNLFKRVQNINKKGECQSTKNSTTFFIIFLF
jgi:hypothetical protein